MKKTALILKITKSIIDVTMAILLLLLMGYHLLDGSAHEWIGISLFLLFVGHNALNYKWYMALFKGKYGVVRIIQTSLNLLLWIAMICCVISSMNISGHVFTWMNLNGVMMGRKLHLLTTIWVFILVSLHFGFHWSYFVSMAKKITKPSKNLSFLLRWGFRAILLVLCVFAIIIFKERAYWEEMFLMVEFKWFNYEKNILLYFLESLVLMTMFTAIGYYLKKIIIQINLKFKKQKLQKTNM